MTQKEAESAEGVFHCPVMLGEVLEYLGVQPGRKYIDATVGGGGHSAAILEKGGEVLGVDADPEAVEHARKRLAAKSQVPNPKFQIVRGNFREIDEIAREHGFGEVWGVLYDLGMSSFQLEHSGRGFSFKRGESLDMRMDPSLKVKAADLINALSVKELTALFRRYGEEPRARAIARGIVAARAVRPITTSRQLAELIVDITKVGGTRSRIHPATRVFQALRIAVNDELNSLRQSLSRAASLLVPGGRMVVISFHSLEDRIVKDFGRTAEGKRLSVKTMFAKPIRPSEKEIQSNPRSRSARLRVFEKI